MKQIITIIFVLLSFSLSAEQTGRENARSVYCQYDFDADVHDESAPEGFEPFYISHYGRHGARYIYNDSEYELLYDVFARAFEADVLTPLGKELYDRFMKVYPHFHGRAGDLTSLGKKQHAMLADRMTRAYPQVFCSDADISAVTSTYPRCIMSMNSFCDALRARGLEVNEDVDSRDMSYIAPYTGHNPKFKGEDQGWRKEYEAYFDARFDRMSFYARLFSDAAFQASLGDDMNFIMTLYYMDAHMKGTEFPEIGFGEAFSDDDYALCNEMDNIKFYMRKGWGEGIQGELNVALGESLMQDILDKADEALGQERPSADLRFGHDGAVMTLLAFLRAECWNEQTDDMSRIKDVWDSCKVPMASNIRFVFCRRGEDVIVKAQHNESDLVLPLNAYEGPYYRWNDFKEYYQKLIDDSNIILNR